MTLAEQTMKAGKGLKRYVLHAALLRGKKWQAQKSHSHKKGKHHLSSNIQTAIRMKKLGHVWSVVSRSATASQARDGFVARGAKNGHMKPAPAAIFVMFVRTATLMLTCPIKRPVILLY